MGLGAPAMSKTTFCSSPSHRVACLRLTISPPSLRKRCRTLDVPTLRIPRRPLTSKQVVEVRDSLGGLCMCWLYWLSSCSLLGVLCAALVMVRVKMMKNKATHTWTTGKTMSKTKVALPAAHIEQCIFGAAVAVFAAASVPDCTHAFGSFCFMCC